METRKLKAAFFDIDGTLVSFKTHKVPESTILAIKHLRSKGVKVFIATGRPVPFTKKLGDLEFDGIMSTNGACCMTWSGETICKHPVPKDDIKRLVEDSHINPMPIIFASNEEAMLCDEGCDLTIVKEVFDLLDIALPEQHSIKDVQEMDVVQIIAFFEKKDENRIMKQILEGCSAERWHPAFADCICSGKSKATGVEAICKYYGFDTSEVAAFGDGGNDISMLNYAGTGIAMGSASEEVKKAANWVTDNVDEDGIAHAITSLWPELGFTYK